MIARFHPRAWIQDHAVEVDPAGEVEWDVTEFFSGLSPSQREEYARADTDLSDMLCFEGDPPEWVRAWQGPFYVEVFFESGGASGSAAPTAPAPRGADRDRDGTTRVVLSLAFAGDVSASSVIQHLRETFNDDDSLVETHEIGDPACTRLQAFVEEVAKTLYDGRECSHDDGCHDHWSCSLCDHDGEGCGREADRLCALGQCCQPVDMGNDETHANLVRLVESAKALLAYETLSGP